MKLENLAFAAPDVGSTNRVREVASYFNAEMVICDKHRKRANEIASMVVIGDVTGKDIVLVDDICDTGGTLAKAAALLKEKGARSVRALITHPVLSGKAYENIENSVLEELVVCDTIPLKQESSKIIQGEFSLKNLGYFIKCTNLCQQIEVYLENDLPLVVKYNVASLGSIRMALAALPSS